MAGIADKIGPKRGMISKEAAITAKNKTKKTKTKQKTKNKTMEIEQPKKIPEYTNIYGLFSKIVDGNREFVIKLQDQEIYQHVSCAIQKELQLCIAFLKEISSNKNIENLIDIIE
jgi:hypothetical protein